MQTHGAAVEIHAATDTDPTARTIARHSQPANQRRQITETARPQTNTKLISSTDARRCSKAKQVWRLKEPTKVNIVESKHVTHTHAPKKCQGWSQPADQESVAT